MDTTSTTAQALNTSTNQPQQEHLDGIQQNGTDSIRRGLYSGSGSSPFGHAGMETVRPSWIAMLECLQYSTTTQRTAQVMALHRRMANAVVRSVSHSATDPCC